MESDKLKNSNKDKISKMNYQRWKLEALDESGYFIIFQGFLEKGLLKEISGNALKLYIYLGMNSSNLEGVVWHSNERISKYFGKSERTIRLWMNELEKIDLIKRMRLNYNGNVYTYLQPYNYKWDSKEEQSRIIIEGELHIDEINTLYIRGNNTYIPLTSNMYIDLWDHNRNIWTSGKIESRRANTYLFLDKNENKIIYIFKSHDGKLIVNIEKDKPLNVRCLVL
jgi:hypothetical protein